MTKRIVAMALLVTLGFGGVITVRVRQLNAQLTQRNIELNDAKLQLAEAQKKLAFLETSKTRVQVMSLKNSTGYCERLLTHSSLLHCAPNAPGTGESGSRSGMSTFS